MNEKIQALTERLKNGKLILFLGIAGILLIFVSSFSFGEKEAEPAKADTFDTAAYTEDLEQSVTKIVQGITGSKEVTVVITLDSDITYNYADETKTNKSNKQSNSSVDTATDSEQKYIIITDSSGNETALLKSCEMPQIRGVAVIYKGETSEQINTQITDALTSLLGVTSKRIYISGGK